MIWRNEVDQPLSSSGVKGQTELQQQWMHRVCLREYKNVHFKKTYEIFAMDNVQVCSCTRIYTLELLLNNVIKKGQRLIDWITLMANACDCNNLNL